MNRRIEPHICMILINILLLSVSQCLAFPKMGRREIAHTEGQIERRNVDDLEKPRPSKQTAQMTVIEDSNIVLTKLSGTSLNNDGGETQLIGGSNVFTHSQSTDVYTPTESVASSDEGGFNPGEPNKDLSESRLTTVVTTVVSPKGNAKADFFSSSSNVPTVEEATEAGQGFPKHLNDQFLETESKADHTLEHSTTTQVNTEEMLTTNPRTGNLEITIDHTTTSSSMTNPTAEIGMGILTSSRDSPSQLTSDHPQATVTDHLLDPSEYFPSMESETDRMPGGMAMAASAPTAALGVPAASALNEDWDDTKLVSTSQKGASAPRDNAETIHVGAKDPQILQPDHDDVKGGEPLADFADAILGQVGERTHTGASPAMVNMEEKSVAFTDQSSFPLMNPKEDTKGTTISPLQNTRHPELDGREYDTLFFSVSTVPLTDSQSEAYYTVGNTLTDSIAQEMMSSQDGGATLLSVTQEQDSTPEITRESEEAEERNRSPSPIMVVSSVTQLSRKSEYLATTVSATAMPLSLAVTPALTVTISKEETFPPAFDSSVTLPGMMEDTISQTSVSIPSTIRTIASIRHMSTSVTYDLEQMESQGEEDEDEEVEEEEEEEEEEDEEDKDEDSLDESMEGDTELPGFTLPGITSQEPRLDRGNLEPLEGVSYQVPDAIEWEQQNQGLVRSWMEKLKDKAGYMSGMLVPVGVGIAGALFILGALYSIKIMNRRRRNGFKRHKRKQREFNSMQDRVMLLADSSEDEF
ncbi:armadillo-like helical domain-containing protein 4 [Gracilinanus agilis]|uniref:armadillo-like helical domain-containing protein 4 n=1 Tax=Gracilinanus agilis TaxID=191870 RepID=UPI001CFE51B9|nr:armadillo-like helical domain-containing protein 4 [Gracilinanus agilis]